MGKLQSSPIKASVGAPNSTAALDHLKTASLEVSQAFTPYDSLQFHATHGIVNRSTRLIEAWPHPLQMIYTTY